MFIVSKSFVAALTLGAGLLAAGCQSQPAVHSPTGGVVSNEAVMCTKCEVTWTKVPIDGGKGRVVGYSSQRRMVCPDCRTAAENFFRTGKFQHTCATCGDSLQHCKVH